MNVIILIPGSESLNDIILSNFACMFGTFALHSQKIDASAVWCWRYANKTQRLKNQKHKSESSSTYLFWDKHTCGSDPKIQCEQNSFWPKVWTKHSTQVWRQVCDYQMILFIHSLHKQFESVNVLNVYEWIANVEGLFCSCNSCKYCL